MPSFEEEGLAEFVDELREHLSPHVARLRFLVIDDCSSRWRPSETLQHGQHADVRVERNTRNLGHGPSVMSAYSHALAERCDVIMHVDGDGQFHGEDVARLLQQTRYADVVIGERIMREEPWYRRAITHGLASGLAGRTGPVSDVNTPLRAYRYAALASLWTTVPTMSVVPHVLLTLRLPSNPYVVSIVPVRSRHRRGRGKVGTTWGSSPWSSALPSRNFVLFCLRAAIEVLCDREVGTPAQPRGITSPSAV